MYPTMQGFDRVQGLNGPLSNGTSRLRGPGRRRDGCTECKRKKVRCDLARPTCTRCLRYPRGCIYNLSIIPDKPSKPQEKRNSPSAIARQPSLKLSPLFSSEQDQFYMHVFGTETALRLFPAAPRVFLQSLISSATQTPHLFYALLAAACSHHGRLVDYSNSEPPTLCLKYTTLALSSLNSTLQTSTEQTLTAETVATAMALCTNDVCNGNMAVWRTHLAGAGDLLTTLLKTRSAAGDPYIDCLVKWFTTLNVLSGMSGSHSGCLDLDAISTQPEPSDSEITIDNICGYSLDLVPLLVRMSHLINGGDLDIETEGPDASLIETQLHALLTSPAAPEPSSPTGLSTTELQHTHAAFVHCSLLHLHRRVRKLAKHNPLVRSDIANILATIGAIAPSSSANILILWPIFSAGCETDDLEERSLIQERMGYMRKLGLGNFTRAAQLLDQYWASNTALPWDVYFSTLGLEMVLF
ncbi:fungal-specific transcription factor domain-containing protein [Aspergillus heterothallicus]